MNGRLSRGSPDDKDAFARAIRERIDQLKAAIQ